VVNIVGGPMFGAEVVLNDGTSLSSVITETDGSYDFSRLREGGNYTVSASLPHFTMSPPSQSFSNLSSDQVVNFTANTSDSDFYTISGQVTENGVGLPGVTVTLSGSQLGLRTTDSNGNYSFVAIVAGNYTVTPSLPGFTFAPPSQTFNSLSGPQTANFTAGRQSFVVTNVNNHGTGSLREAIINANATIGTDTIIFNIPGPGVKTINLITQLPEITDSVVIDGTTQPGYAGTPLIELDGAIATANGTPNGLVVKAGGTTVRGLAIGNFNSGFGIWLNGCNNNVIQGNYLGLNAAGTAARPNNRGILLSNSSNNIIGGTTLAARNVISGNTILGIELGGNSNVVQGNFIGTNAAGTAAFSNNNAGVYVPSSQFTNNLIGGTAAGAGNLISGNQKGIQASGTGTTIQGNLIGTDLTGTSRIPNGIGVEARGTDLLVGGQTTSARNIISGNTGDGVVITGTGSKLQGNFIGTDVTGTLALSNFGSGVVAGNSAVIGGLVPEARNIIAANGFGNISLGSNSTGSAATVQGNYIGTDVTGMRALPNPSQTLLPNISISSNNNVVGGTVAGARNVISGNNVGIQIGEVFNPPQGNVIQGNFIGLNAAGTGAVPNIRQGILIVNASNTTIGGTQAGAANKIAFNGAPGVVVVAGTGNAIRGNSIFSNGALGIDLAPGALVGVTPNDNTDADTGPNNVQNFPVLTSVLSTSNSTTIQGSLTSTPNTVFQIDFYSNAALDPSGNGEGALFFNTTQITTDANGNANINVTVPAGLPTGRIITATATDPSGNTSEFSAGDSAGAAGSVQFSVGSIQVIEDVGVANVTVLRTGGSVGTLTVDYSTSDETAIAGQDYTSISGTLSFAAGEASKTLQMPILDDAITETDETFRLALRSDSDPEVLGTPSVLTVTVQDRSTTPRLSITGGSVVEGSTGSTTEILFTINLSAATSRSISVHYATTDFSAFGGPVCGKSGVDYEIASGTASFPAGTTSFTVPLRVCGDASAEANETFGVVLSNPVNATLQTIQAVGTITNDDELLMLLENSGPIPNLAAAVDALLSLRDPFRIVGIPETFATGPDRNTRVLFFAQNLALNPGEGPSAVIVRFAAGNNQTFDVPADDVRQVFEVPDALTANPSEFTQVKVRLPAILPVGTHTVTIRAHGRVSNAGTIRIVP
jgi:hypothetical protein